MSSVRIGLLGDVMLGRSVGRTVREGADPAELWEPALRELLCSLDLVVCNLECCLSTRGSPTTLIPEKPFFFRGPPQAVGALEAIGAGVVGVANNHLLDFGAVAAADTLGLLVAHGISVCGAGSELSAARSPAVVDRAGMRIGVIAAADHPSQYAAGADRLGTAYADMRHGVPKWLGDGIVALRERCDVVLVFPHWGPNMTSRPADWQRAAAVEMCAAGADVVAGHSAHVFHGIAFEQRHPVIFDLGGALDDYRVDPVLRNDLGLLAVWDPLHPGELDLSGLALEYCRTRLADAREADWIAARLERACGELGSSVSRVDTNLFRARPSTHAATSTQPRGSS